ncbi:hypothetical protein PsorP6_016484 [Peronosclerospora sorghi]|uniref:Uncharacterized protein n=1 Tax=Peronosclerospora sorghi TaxID=230839 RepID=A0ACC0VK22_9STRA|nr:hypothetical protein PsorP6_016484 [Peronosclerospora sorghi]
MAKAETARRRQRRGHARGRPVHSANAVDHDTNDAVPLRSSPPVVASPRDDDSEVDEADALSSSDDDAEALKRLHRLVDGLVETTPQSSTLADVPTTTETGTLTLATLVDGTVHHSHDDDKDDTAWTQRVRAHVRALEGDGTSLTLARAHTLVDDARSQRQSAYGAKKQDVHVFESVVRRNRQRETLDLRVQAPTLEKPTPVVLASKFVANSAMEHEIAALLAAGDLSDKQIGHDERTELAMQQVTRHEVAARQRALARLRSLLFYEEQKTKRVKKIKSKLYHKIRKAQHERAHDVRAGLDPERAREVKEQLASKRAHERLTLKHRNTSKWVTHQLARGTRADNATRRAIAEQLRRGDDLRRKMENVSSDEDDEEDQAMEGHERDRVQQDVEEQARALVTEIDAERTDATKKHGLDGMKFMQRAAAKQREQARVEAEQLLRDVLRGEQEEMESEPEAAAAKADVKVTEDDRAAVDRVLAKDALQTSRVGMSTGLAVRVDGAVAIDLGDGGDTVHHVTDDTPATNNVLELGNAVASDHEANPWLAPRARVPRTSSRKHEHKSTPPVAAALASLTSDTSRLPNDAPPPSSDILPRPPKRSKPAPDTALMRRAFEFVATQEDEIAAEKDKLASEDAAAKHGAEQRQLVGMAGWGTWVGAGVRVSQRQVAREKAAHALAERAKAAALGRRRDVKLARVLVNEKKDKRAAKFNVADVPYPFTSREEYHAAMRVPLGSDWNTAHVTNVLTAPKVMKRLGTRIAPLTLSKDEKKHAIKDASLKRKAKW